MEQETRIWNPQLQELRAETGEDGKVTVSGLAVPYGQTSEDLGGFREMFMAGAFAETISENREVFADVEHDAKKKLGRRTKSSLELQDTVDGLRFRVKLPDTQLGRDTAEEVRSGLLDGVSIAFTDADANWFGKGKDTLRKVNKAALRAITLTSYPAYRQTVGSLAMRSLEEYRTTEGSTEPEYDPSESIREKNRCDRELLY